MNWDALGALGELVGAAAVVLTLFYLARQVAEASDEAKRNQTELRRSRYDELNRELARCASEWGSTPELSDIMLRGFSGTASLSREEMFRFYALLQRYFRCLEALFVYSSEGGVHTWGAAGWRVATADFITFPGVLEYWEDRRHWYSESFGVELDKLRSDSGSVIAEAYAVRALSEHE